MPTGFALLLALWPVVRLLSTERLGLRHVCLLRQVPLLPLLERQRGQLRRRALLLQSVALLRAMVHHKRPICLLALLAVLLSCQGVPQSHPVLL